MRFFRRSPFRCRSFVLISFCLLLCCAPAYGQINDEESQAWNEPVKPHRVIGNVYYVGAKEVSSFLIES